MFFVPVVGNIYLGIISTSEIFVTVLTIIAAKKNTSSIKIELKAEKELKEEEELVVSGKELHDTIKDSMVLEGADQKTIQKEMASAIKENHYLNIKDKIHCTI